ERDFAEYSGITPLQFHGPVAQGQLADAFRSGSVLVLPSLEEGFGLVVPQALACGLPVIVSNRVGAKDLVRQRENGSVVPVQDPVALAEELQWWADNPRRVREDVTWKKPVELLLSHSRSAMRNART
ncbi:MAG: glycosyltransferase, partial [Verrucomicrobiaceae bacterium]